MMKKALVTGAARGIGRAIALRLAHQGYDVAIHYRNSKDAAQKTAIEARDAGVDAVILQADVTQDVAARSLARAAAQDLGGLSVLVNNVGDYAAAPTSLLTAAVWHATLASNLHATFYLTQAAIPDLIASGNGRIVNIAAAGAQEVRARTTNTIYMIAKTGVVIYSKSLARELIGRDVTVNVVAPGINETSFEYRPDYSGPTPVIPAGRPATSQEIADAVWGFVRPEASYVTGQVLEVAGGWGL